MRGATCAACTVAAAEGAGVGSAGRETERASDVDGVQRDIVGGGAAALRVLPGGAARGPHQCGARLYAAELTLPLGLFPLPKLPSPLTVWLCADLCTGLDTMELALTELEDGDNVMHADLVHQAIDDATERYRAGVQQSFDALEQEGLVVMRMPIKSSAPAPRAAACGFAGGVFVAAEEAAIDAELCELRRRLAARGAECRRLEQEYRLSERAGAKCAEVLPAVQRAVGSRGEFTRRLVCDVSALSDRVQSLTHSVDDDLRQM